MRQNSIGLKKYTSRVCIQDKCSQIETHCSMWFLALGTIPVAIPGPQTSTLSTFSNCSVATAFTLLRSGIRWISLSTLPSGRLCWRWATFTLSLIECFTLGTHEVTPAVTEVSVPFLVAKTSHQFKTLAHTAPVFLLDHAIVLWAFRHNCLQLEKQKFI